MKLFYPAFFIISILFFSCDNKQFVPESQPQETPKALQTDNESSGGSYISKKRYDNDLVEELYNELLEKNAALSSLEQGIEKLKDDKKDSAVLFNTFDSKNNSYYSSANMHIGAIKDSGVKERIRQIIDNSLSKYKTKIAAHNNLIAAINSKDITLDDLHIVLKLSQTLRMIEQYQTSDLPSTRPLENTIKVYDKIIIKTDSLSKK
jgi:hypothetical protein